MEHPAIQRATQTSQPVHPHKTQRPQRDQSLRTLLSLLSLYTEPTHGSPVSSLHNVAQASPLPGYRLPESGPLRFCAGIARCLYIVLYRTFQIRLLQAAAAPRCCSFAVLTRRMLRRADNILSSLQNTQIPSARLTQRQGGITGPVGLGGVNTEGQMLSVILLQPLHIFHGNQPDLSASR